MHRLLTLTGDVPRPTDEISLALEAPLFLIDTNILSDAKKSTKHSVLCRWLRQQDSIAIPFSAFLEIEQGIAAIEQTRPGKAEELNAWMNTLLASDYEYPAMTPEVARVLARLYNCRPLKNLWCQEPQSKKKPGQDLAIAAVAIVYNLPIATLNGRDFILIDQYFELPGVYNPVFNLWLVPAERDCHEGLTAKACVA